MENNKIKVLYIQHSGFFGGSGRSLFEIVKEAMTLGVKPYFICQRGKMAEIYKGIGDVIEVSGLSQFDNTRYGYYRKYRWFILLREFFYIIPTLASLYKVKKKYKNIIDVIHINEYTLLLPAIFAKLILRKKLVIHCRSYQRSSRNSLRARIIEKIFNSIDAHIIAIDEICYSTVYGIKNKTIIHNSFDPKKLSTDSEEFFTKENNSLKLCAVGSISVQKGILELLEAVGICKNKGLNVNLYIVGEYEKTSKSKIVSQILKEVKGSSNIQEDVRRTIAKYDLQDVVIFSGFVSNLSLVYKKIDVLCFVSRFNAPGRPIFEAGYYNIPSIVAIDRSWNDTIVDKTTGLIVNENDPYSIATAIEYLYHNRDERIRLGKNAHLLNRSNFDPTRNGNLLYNFYKLLK